jgi:hypothetical protein
MSSAGDIIGRDVLRRPFTGSAVWCRASLKGDRHSADSWGTKSEETGRGVTGMLTPLQGDQSTTTSLREGKMPPLLDNQTLLADPAAAAPLVLRLICELADEYGEPVEHEQVQWFTENVPENSPSLAALNRALGPRPRRANLLTVIGDLVDHGLLEQTPDGFFTTEEGRLALKHLQAHDVGFAEVVVA